MLHLDPKIFALGCKQHPKVKFADAQPRTQSHILQQLLEHFVKPESFCRWRTARPAFGKAGQCFTELRSFCLDYCWILDRVEAALGLAFSIGRYEPPFFQLY